MKRNILQKRKNQSELRASFNTIRVGLSYRLVNYGEISSFKVLEIINDDDCIVRSLDTLETFHLNDLVKFGKGPDFEFDEI